MNGPKGSDLCGVCGEEFQSRFDREVTIDDDDNLIYLHTYPCWDLWHRDETDRKNNKIYQHPLFI